MGFLDRLLGRTKQPSTEDPVGPIGGSMRPVTPLDTAPYIYPGNPGGTYSPRPQDIPPIEAVQQAPINYMSVPSSPMVGDLPQRILWPTEIHSEPRLAGNVFKGRGADPNWFPEEFDPGRPARSSYSFNRPWHLAPRLDGNRTYLSASDIPVPSSEGYVGLRAAPRASMFTEPAPWGTNVIDTTRASGTPTIPGDAQTPTSIQYSPSQFAGSNNRSYRLS